jgi:hypothetical protein
VDPAWGPVQTLAVAPEADQQAPRARPVRRALGAALLAVLVAGAGACARPAERDGTAATTAPSTTTPTVTSQDAEALRRLRLDVEHFCMVEFPDHCAGVTLVEGPTGAGITLVPAGKKPPGKRDQAEFRRRLEQLSGEKMSDQEFAAFMELFERFPQPGPEDIARLAALGAPGLEWLAKNQVVVYRRSLAALDAAVRQRFSSPAAELRFVDATYSFKYLDALGKRILTEQPANGVNISQVGIEPDGSGVRVVTPDARRARQQLERRYGPAVIVTEGP